MIIDQRNKLQPLLTTFSTQNYRLPLGVMSAIFALSDGKFEASYLDARVDDDGIHYVFSWLQNGIFGQVTASSSDTAWPDKPLRDRPADAQTAAQLRRVTDIDRIELAKLAVWQEEFTGGALGVDAPIRIHFVDGHTVVLGDDYPRNTDDREKRDEFVSAVMRAFGVPRP